MIALIALVSLAQAQAPDALVHQGRVIDASGEPVNGEFSATLMLYTQATGGTAAWSEPETLTVASGYYTAVLGDTVSLDAVNFADNAYWFELSLGGQVMGARQPLHAVPVALSIAGGGVWATVDEDIVYGEGAVGIGVSEPHASATLEVGGTSGGLLAPRLTATQRDAIADPAPGLIVFNTTSSRLEVFNGFGWSTAGSGGAGDSSAAVGSVVGWGYNNTYMLGNGSTADQLTPNYTSMAELQAIDIAQGAYYHQGQGAGCAVTVDHDLYCWGRQYFIPDGTNNDVATPTQVGVGIEWQSVFIGTSLQGCGLSTDGTAYCWGYQQYGALGNRVAANSYLDAPNAVSIYNHTWAKLVLGGQYNESYNHHAYVCGFTTDTSGPNGYCWGGDRYGLQANGGGEADHQMGTSGENYGPITGIIWADMSASSYSACGVDTSGVGWCWGYGGHGSLGNGGTANQTSPVQVAGGYRWTKIETGRQHTCGLLTDGRAMCWGRNDHGQLGGGVYDTSTEPRFVAGGHRFVDIAASAEHTCALDYDGRAWCWGYAANGELGTGTTTQYNSPVQVSGAFRFSKIDAGYYSTMGITR